MKERKQLKIVKYYEHNQTNSIYYKPDIKLRMNDVYTEYEDGSFRITKVGEKIVHPYAYSETVDGEERVVKEEENVEDENVEEENVEDENALNEMTKKELEAFAKEKFGVDLDRRKTKSSLIEEIKKLSEGE